VSERRISPDGEVSARELTVRLGEQAGVLLRREIALAKAELFAKARQAAMGGGLLTTAALLGLTGWLALVAAAIAGIATALPVWAAALIVGAALLALAGVLARPGLRHLSAGAQPPRLTAQSLRRDVEVLRKRTRR
jgi:hypothetical protein